MLLGRLLLVAAVSEVGFWLRSWCNQRKPFPSSVLKCKEVVLLIINDTNPQTWKPTMVSDFIMKFTLSGSLR